MIARLCSKPKIRFWCAARAFVWKQRESEFPDTQSLQCCVRVYFSTCPIRTYDLYVMNSLKRRQKVLLRRPNCEPSKQRLAGHQRQRASRAPSAADWRNRLEAAPPIASLCLIARSSFSLLPRSASHHTVIFAARGAYLYTNHGNRAAKLYSKGRLIASYWEHDSLNFSFLYLI